MEGIGTGFKKIFAMVVGGIVILLGIGNMFINAWPQVAVLSGNVTSMTETDLGTTTMKWVFPLVLLIFGLVIGIALIIWAIDQI